MSLELLVGGEDDELVGETVRVLAQEVGGAEVQLELRVVAVELRVERGKQAVAEEALEVILPQMPPQPPVVVVALVAELTERMPFEGAAMLPGVRSRGRAEEGEGDEERESGEGTRAEREGGRGGEGGREGEDWDESRRRW
eukprot:400294-Hanusia_phi.AAC.1